jgi:hypothetical protein
VRWLAGHEYLAFSYILQQMGNPYLCRVLV